VYITLEPKFYWIVLWILRNLLALTLVREQQSLVDVGTHSQQFHVLSGIPTASAARQFVQLQGMSDIVVLVTI
jgi:hypothetical protein